MEQPTLHQQAQVLLLKHGYPDDSATVEALVKEVNAVATASQLSAEVVLGHIFQAKGIQAVDVPKIQELLSTASQVQEPPTLPTLPMNRKQRRTKAARMRHE